LRQEYGTRDIRPLLEPFETLAADESFWNHTLDGLAVLAAPGIFRVYRLQRTVPELAVVAESFHLKPLLRILQSADRYQILALTRGNVSLFEGNRDMLDRIDVAPAAGEAIAEAQDKDREESNLSVWTHGSDSAQAGVYQSQGSEERAVDSAAERFFRTVDRAILKHHSRASGLPLLLASLPQHQSLFRRISHNPLLMRKGIEIDPHALNVEELRERAWRVVEPDYLERLVGLVEMFGSARAKGLGSADLRHVADAAVAGRVATLLVEAERHVPGRIDSSTGEVSLDELARPDVDDLLDDLAELAPRNGGQVVIVPAARMPTDTGLAAIYRF
jgi:peptide subunit release factor 1 (eRF1)